MKTSGEVGEHWPVVESEQYLINLNSITLAQQQQQIGNLFRISHLFLQPHRSHAAFYRKRRPRGL
jgi:hypothetical protein